MKKLQCIIVLIAISLSQIFYANAQTRNLYVEGSGDQLGVIHTTSLGNSYSGLELLRSSEFNGSDWRIINDGGLFKLSTGINNFATEGTVNLQMSTTGRLQLLEGSEASIGDDTGVLMLGRTDGPNLALDQNEILARNGERYADLFLQAGPIVGNTLLNIADGNVGIGTVVPNAKMSIENNGFQLQLKNRDDNDSDWYIGASQSGWVVGTDKLVFSPSKNSRSALLILDDNENVVDVNNNRIVKVADPVNPKDAVNLKTLKSIGKTTEISSLLSIPNYSTFTSCGEYCSELSEGGNTDWHLPSHKQLLMFMKNGDGSWTWTSEYEGLQPVEGENFPLAHYRIVSKYTGNVQVAPFNAESAQCRCVR